MLVKLAAGQSVPRASRVEQISRDGSNGNSLASYAKDASSILAPATKSKFYASFNLD